MRKYFLYLLAALVLTSCDNLKKKDVSEDDTEETTKKKKKKPLDEDENMDEEVTPKKKKVVADDEETPVDDENLDNVDNNDGWSERERTKFLDQCVTDASVNVGEGRAKQYCNCFLKKVEKKYSSYNEADTRMTQTELNTWAGECNR